jgi:DNA polymerase-1
MNNKVALIDGDITIFQIASAAEQPTDFGDDLWVLWADLKVAKMEFDSAVEAIREKCDCDGYKIYLTSKNNFRKTVSATYKANRSGKRKPMLLPALRKYAIEHYGASCADFLEGDDLIGIAATSAYKYNHVIYSADKDLKTIAGTHYDPEGNYEITQKEADRAFYTQILTGDATDGYNGCPSIGPVSAAKILDKTDGSRLAMWEAVVETYSKKGLDELDAIIQARQAFILTHEFWDEKGNVKLWEPPNA